MTCATAGGGPTIPCSRLAGQPLSHTTAQTAAAAATSKAAASRGRRNSPRREPRSSGLVSAASIRSQSRSWKRPFAGGASRPPSMRSSARSRSGLSLTASPPGRQPPVLAFIVSGITCAAVSASRSADRAATRREQTVPFGTSSTAATDP